MTDATFAQQSRQRCAPIECTYAQTCWVVTGKVDKAAHVACPACDGRIRTENWQPPGFTSKPVYFGPTKGLR